MGAPHNLKTILLLEEQHEMAAVLRTSLERLDVSIRVVLATSAQHAAQALLAERIDLLIADVASPGLSGLELLQRGRQQHPELQAILLSAIHDPKIRTQATKTGAQAFFYKPVELADLLDAVERTLGLVGSILPPEIEFEPPQARANLANQVGQGLSELLFSLQASAVGLYNRQGQLLAHAGTLPQALQAGLSPNLFNLHLAAQKIASETFHAFHQANQHLLLHCQDGYAMLLLCQPLSPARMAAHAEALNHYTGLIQPALLAWQAARSAPKQIVADPALEAELKKAETKPINRAETDRFWKEHEVEAHLQPANGSLSYDQAALLGLTPKNS